MKPSLSVITRKLAALGLGVLAISASATLHATVELPPFISDHMVLQRDIAAPIWGKAAAGEEVTVSIAGQTQKATAGADRKWQVKLDPLKATAEPLTLTVTGTNTIEVKDVLVGEVWLGSGQSNMAGPIRTYKGKDPGLQKLLDAAPYPTIRLSKSGTGWLPANAASVDAYSAILFAFGAKLQAELKVPMGLLLGAVGGTPSGHWLTEDMFRNDAACQAQVKAFAATYDPEAAMKAYERYHNAWLLNVEKAKRTGANPGREPLEPKPPGECMGGEFGHLYIRHVQPYVPYAIRGVLWDQGEGGTFITGADQFHVMGALIKGWRKEWNQDFPFVYVQKPSGGGTAWDLANPTTKEAFKLTPQPVLAPRNIDGLQREVHIKIQTHPKTAMVTSTDLGGMTHPINKSGYADRARQVAMSFVYGGKEEYSGPLYASHTIEGDKVRIRFTHTGKGLAARHADKLQGFIIAGANKKFVWADAVIDGDSVLVSSKDVPKPAAVRYAWHSTSPWANLFNQDGLPAQTFRTDDWK